MGTDKASKQELLGKRVLIKLSGEALGDYGQAAQVINYEKVDLVARVLAQLQCDGLEMGIVIGGGNIYRGRNGGTKRRADGDHMGMLATAINSIALKDALLSIGARVNVFSAIEMDRIFETYTQQKANDSLDAGEIAIFACGTGLPYVSTDTAGVLRALEIGADLLLCGKNIDGVYDKDPQKYPDAQRYDEIGYNEVIEKQLQALDLTATALCCTYKLPVFVFELKEPRGIAHALWGKMPGTWIR